MRSPVIAFSIFAAAAVSPTLVSGAPATPVPPNVGGGGLVPHGVPGGLGALPVLSHTRREDEVPALDDKHGHGDKHRKSHHKRALDGDTAGGNAYSGGTSDSTGGSVVNEAEDDPDDVITNDTGSSGGVAGTSISGDAEGGRGRDRGPGGNAYTGDTGRAQGGSTINEGGDIDNAAESNVAGDGNESLSGNAEGGDAKKKRAFDAYTAGGNAYTGSSGDTGSGNNINEADDDATITNTGPGVNFGNQAGDSTTGDAEGGRGNNKGPGGNAYTGFAGPTRGGNTINSAGSIDNTGGTNTGGNGGDSASGFAFGGDAA